VLLGVSSCSLWWVSSMRVGGFSLVVVLGFCGSLFHFCYPSRCSYCILPAYLGGHYAFNKIWHYLYKKKL
jgi:hypothetical protein